MSASSSVAAVQHESFGWTWRSLYEQLRQKFKIAIATAILSFAASAIVLHFMATGFSVLTRGFASAGVAVLCDVALGVFLLYQVTYQNMTKALASYEGLAHQRTLEALEFEQDLSSAREQLDFLRDYIGVADISEIESVLPTVHDKSIQDLRRESWRATAALSKLIRNGIVAASYEEQLRFAEVFANQSQRYFRATCFDRPSDFEGKNFYYLDDLERLPNRVKEAPGAVTPLIGRIFVVDDARTLAEDIESESIRILDLYERHLRWGRAVSVDSAMRFLVIPHKQYLAFFNRFGLVDPSEIIEDFMVVDDRFVYGRRQGQHGPKVELGYLDDSTLLQRYNTLYDGLWRASRSMEQVVRSLKGQFPGLDSDLEEFLVQCAKRRSKLDIIQDYQEVFSQYEWRGVSFFTRVCELLAGGTNYCFAVDRADKKEGSLWRIWQESPYREFRESSKDAARHASVFQRLFILQNWPKPEERPMVEALIRDFTFSNLHIGFLHVDNARLSELTDKFDTDFIVVGVDANCTNVENALGFELQQQKFDVDRLLWTNNLIAKSQLQRHGRIFQTLWNRSGTVKVTSSDPAEVKAKTDFLILEGARANETTT